MKLMDEEKKQMNFRSKIFVTLILVAITFAVAEGVYYFTKSNNSEELIIRATVFSGGKIISQPEIAINSGVEATISESGEQSSVSMKILAHLMKEEVLVDLDFCQGKAIATYEAPEDLDWCEQQSEQKVMVKLGETVELPLNNGIIQLRVLKIANRREDFTKINSLHFLVAKH